MLRLVSKIILLFAIVFLVGGVFFSVMISMASYGHVPVWFLLILFSPGILLLLLALTMMTRKIKIIVNLFFSTILIVFGILALSFGFFLLGFVTGGAGLVAWWLLSLTTGGIFLFIGISFFKKSNKKIVSNVAQVQQKRQLDG